MPVERIGVVDARVGVCYLYTLLDDHTIEVRKLPEIEAREFTMMDDLRMAEDRYRPDYVIAGGTCSCPGFDFRGSCKHVEKTVATGWLRMADRAGE